MLQLLINQEQSIQFYTYVKNVSSRNRLILAAYDKITYILYKALKLLNLN